MTPEPVDTVGSPPEEVDRLAWVGLLGGPFAMMWTTGSAPWFVTWVGSIGIMWVMSKWAATFGPFPRPRRRS